MAFPKKSILAYKPRFLRVPTENYKKAAYLRELQDKGPIGVLQQAEEHCKNSCKEPANENPALYCNGKCPVWKVKNKVMTDIANKDMVSLMQDIYDGAIKDLRASRESGIESLVKKYQSHQEELDRTKDFGLSQAYQRFRDNNMKNQSETLNLVLGIDKNHANLSDSLALEFFC